MSIHKDRLHDITRHIATTFHLRNWRYKLDETNDTIETYFGVLIPLTVIGLSEDKEVYHHVYVKLPTTDESVKVFSDYLWDTEFYCYGTLFPIWKRLSNVNMDELVPQCYYSDATPQNQSLVLKNMKCEGFRNYDGRFLDFEHVVVSLKSLAHFHALSWLIKCDYKEPMASVLKPYTDVFPPKLNVATQNSFRAHFHLFKSSKYERYWEDTLVNYDKIVVESTSKAKCLVYGHGDYWKENIMYKYEINKPVKACIIDFQTCRLMTPANDVLYFILNSTNGSLRSLHYSNFITVYYMTLKNILLDHGLELEKLYEKEEFISDLKTVASLCFLRICLAFSLWLGFESNALIKSKILWKNDHEKDEYLRYFKNILIDAMEDLCNYGYISL